MTFIQGHNIAADFLVIAGRYPDNTAFHYYVDHWRRITYGTLASAAGAQGSRLRAEGVKKGDRVAIVAENRPEWCISYLAVMLAGGIAVPVDAQLGAAEIAVLLGDAAPKAVFYSLRTAAAVGAAAKGISPAPLLIDIDTPGFAGAAGQGSIQVPDKAPDDLASIIYTSGTTGRPKGVMLTHGNFLSDALALMEAQIVSHEDNVLSVLPLHHTYAFMCTFLVPLLLGASMTYPASLKGPDILSAIRENAVSVLIGVPQLLGLIRNGILNKLAALPWPVRLILRGALRVSGMLRQRADINIGRFIFHSAHAALGPHFRFFGSGGARLDPAVMTDLEALGFTVLEGYGLTETSPVVTFNPPQRRKPGSVGRPLPGVEMMIHRQGEGEEGEIVIKGPMVMKGYYNNPEATSAALTDGWFRTGDVGRIDPEGYLFITGRTKEVIVLASGKNVYPEDAEKLYATSPLIKEICIIGVPSPEGGESLHGIIVPDLEYASKARIGSIHEALKWEINKLSARVPSFMRLTGFTVRTEPLPRTPLGKIRRFMIGAEHAGVSRGPAQAAAEEQQAQDETSRLVLREVERFMRPGQRPRLEDNLELDIGLDSLSKIELTVALERIFSRRLPEDFLLDVHTVGELIAKMSAGTPGEAAGVGSKTGWKEILSAQPSEEALRMVSLERPEDPMVFTRIAFLLVKLLFRICFRIEAAGVGNLPASGNFIIAPNHTSYLDGFAAILSLPFDRFKSLYALGLSEFFAGFLRSRLARIAHVIPIDAASYLSTALQMSAYVLLKGRSLCVFPEGGRSSDGELMEFKKGVGILAKELGVAVVPAYIQGAFEALPRGAAFPRFRKITVRFGPPLLAAEMDFSKRPEGMDEYQYFAAILRERVGQLRGEKAASSSSFQ